MYSSPEDSFLTVSTNMLTSSPRRAHGTPSRQDMMGAYRGHDGLLIPRLNHVLLVVLMKNVRMRCRPTRRSNLGWAHFPWEDIGSFASKTPTNRGDNCSFHRAHLLTIIMNRAIRLLPGGPIIRFGKILQSARNPPYLSTSHDVENRDLDLLHSVQALLVRISLISLSLSI